MVSAEQMKNLEMQKRLDEEKERLNLDVMELKAAEQENTKEVELELKETNKTLSALIERARELLIKYNDAKKRLEAIIEMNEEVNFKLNTSKKKTRGRTTKDESVAAETRRREEERD